MTEQLGNCNVTPFIDNFLPQQDCKAVRDIVSVT